MVLRRKVDRDGPDLIVDAHRDSYAELHSLVHGRTGHAGHAGPKSLTDGVEPTYSAWDAGEGDPDDQVDRAIAATRHAVFPEHCLDHIDAR